MMDNDDDKLNELGKQLNLESLSANFSKADAGTLNEAQARVTTFLSEYHKIQDATYANTKLDAEFDLDSMQTKQLQFAKLFYLYGKEIKMFDESMTKKQFYTNCFAVGLQHYMLGAMWVHRDLETYMHNVEELRKDPDKARREFDQMLRGENNDAE